MKIVRNLKKVKFLRQLRYALLKRARKSRKKPAPTPGPTTKPAGTPPSGVQKSATTSSSLLNGILKYVPKVAVFLLVTTIVGILLNRLFPQTQVATQEATRYLIMGAVGVLIFFAVLAIVLFSLTQWAKSKPMVGRQPGETARSDTDTKKTWLWRIVALVVLAIVILPFTGAPKMAMAAIVVLAALVGVGFWFYKLEAAQKTEATEVAGTLIIYSLLTLTLIGFLGYLFGLTLTETFKAAGWWTSVIPVVAVFRAMVDDSKTSLKKAGKWAIILTVAIMVIHLDRTASTKTKTASVRVRTQTSTNTAAFAREWYLKRHYVDSKGRIMRNEPLIVHKVKILRLDEKKIELAMSFDGRDGSESVCYFSWNKEASPQFGSWSQENPSRHGQWSISQSNPNRYDGEIIDERGLITHFWMTPNQVDPGLTNVQP